MALVVENGTGLSNANSYLSLEDVRAYALARGTLLPTDDAELEGMVIRAMDYLEAQRSKFQGTRTNVAQSLQWPRTGVLVDCRYALAPDAIPNELKAALAQLTMEVFGGLVLMPSSDGRVVKKEKVDVIETEYMTSQDTGGAGAGVPMPTFPAVEALLTSLYDVCGGGFRVRTVRVI